MSEQISSYRLESEIARGGMGIVYRAVHTVFDEVVAIKAIFPELTLNPELRTRFVNEAKIQRRLQHPNIVQIREFLIDQGRFYIVMELIEGETLAERLRRLGAPLPANEALEIFRQALQGLAFAHVQGVIHRDMKPSNIMLTREGVAKLTDFGIARAVGVPGLTRSGMVLGTPAYMAPERIQGHQVDKRTDIYSLGVTLYEMVAGRVPFDKPNDFETLRAHIEEGPLPPSRLVPTIPPFIEAAILKAMAKRPEERFASCEEFDAALARPELPPTKQVISTSQPSIALRAVAGQGAAVPKPPPQPGPAKAYAQKLTLTAHEESVRSVGFSPDGRLLASGSFDKTIEIWDVASGSLKRTLSAHQGPVYSVTFSPDGRLLASGSMDKTIKLWDVGSAALRQTLSGHGTYAESVAFSPDGRVLASGSGDNTIKLWDVASGAEKQTLSGHADHVVSVAFSPDGRLLASGDMDGTIKLWEVASGALKQTLSGHADHVVSVAFSPDGRLLASGDMDGTIKLWEVASEDLMQTLSGHQGGVHSVAFSPDGHLLASGSADKTIKLWERAQ